MKSPKGFVFYVREAEERLSSTFIRDLLVNEANTEAVLGFLRTAKVETTRGRVPNRY